jgi:hypothetical protein
LEKQMHATAAQIKTGSSNPHSKGQLRPVASLKLHPLQQHLPAPAERSTAWLAFVASVKQHGIMQPLIVTNDGQIMDGGWRWRAAKELGLSEVPVVVRPEAEASALMLAALLARKLFTRGAAVYLALGLDPSVVTNAPQRRTANLAGPKRNDCALDGTIDATARQWGVSPRLLDDAIRLFKIFRDDPRKKLQHEPQLLAGEAGLGAVLALAAKKIKRADVRRRQAATSALNSMNHLFGRLERCAKSWDTLDRAQRDLALIRWKSALAKLPPALLAAVRPST